MSTTTTTQEKRISVYMSDRAPLSILPSEWPLIARSDDHDGQVECQANTVWGIRVREHANGRRIVYGFVNEGNGGKPRGWRPVHAGFLVDRIDCEPREVDGRISTYGPDEQGTIQAIRRVAGVIDRQDLGNDCIQDLPSEEI